MLPAIICDRSRWQHEDSTHDIALWWTGTKPLAGHFPGPPLSVNFTKIFESSVRVLTAARPPVLRGLIKSSDVELDYSSVVPPDHGRGFESTYTTRFFAILHVSTSPTFTKFSLFGPTGGGCCRMRWHSIVLRK